MSRGKVRALWNQGANAWPMISECCKAEDAISVVSVWREGEQWWFVSVDPETGLAWTWCNPFTDI